MLSPRSRHSRSGIRVVRIDAARNSEDSLTKSRHCGFSKCSEHGTEKGNQSLCPKARRSKRICVFVDARGKRASQEVARRRGKWSLLICPTSYLPCRTEAKKIWFWWPPTFCRRFKSGIIFQARK